MAQNGLKIYLFGRGQLGVRALDLAQDQRLLLRIVVVKLLVAGLVARYGHVYLLSRFLAPGPFEHTRP